MNVFVDLIVVVISISLYFIIIKQCSFAQHFYIFCFNNPIIGLLTTSNYKWLIMIIDHQFPPPLLANDLICCYSCFLPLQMSSLPVPKFHQGQASCLLGWSSLPD